MAKMISDPREFPDRLKLSDITLVFKKSNPLQKEN